MTLVRKVSEVDGNRKSLWVVEWGSGGEEQRHARQSLSRRWCEGKGTIRMAPGERMWAEGTRAGWYDYIQRGGEGKTSERGDPQTPGCEKTRGMEYRRGWAPEKGAWSPPLKRKWPARSREWTSLVAENLGTPSNRACGPGWEWGRRTRGWRLRERLPNSSCGEWGTQGEQRLPRPRWGPPHPGDLDLPWCQFICNSTLKVGF